MELISILSSFAGISVLTATVVCLLCIGVWVKKHMNARVARAQTSARGSVVLTADPEAPTETPAYSQQVNTSPSAQDADSSETENHIKDTVFTDAQFSAGVAPPSYVTASDYKTIQVIYI